RVETAWDRSCRWAEWKLAWDDRRGVPYTDPPHSPQPSRLLLQLPRQILLTALTCTVRDRGPWYRAWLCEDVVGPVRALPSKASTLLLFRLIWRSSLRRTRASRSYPCSTRAFISEYAASMSLLSAAAFAAVPGFSFTWRMNLPVP